MRKPTDRRITATLLVLAVFGCACRDDPNIPFDPHAMLSVEIQDGLCLSPTSITLTNNAPPVEIDVERLRWFLSEASINSEKMGIRKGGIPAVATMNDSRERRLCLEYQRTAEVEGMTGYFVFHGSVGTEWSDFLTDLGRMRREAAEAAGSGEGGVE